MWKCGNERLKLGKALRKAKVKIKKEKTSARLISVTPEDNSYQSGVSEVQQFFTF
jgi:hypothetical protein